MTRQQKIKKMQRAGFRVGRCLGMIENSYFADKGNNRYRANSVNALHKKIYGY